MMMANAWWRETERRLALSCRTFTLTVLLNTKNGILRPGRASL
jgi:hypothetical protein